MCPRAGKLKPGNARREARVFSYRGRQLLEVVKLLRGVTLDENIAVVKSLEVDLDDIGTGVVDPHDSERMGHY
ncbi:Uncharacterised protein [Mycolicibacterium smegmatis]|nr:Uncharacterised protein [Mycolicibacterium smegmatis]